jgi:LacI family transcriptional regulator
MARVPTISDVARDAGVSKSTVSRVLNNTAKISSGTRNRVLEAVKRLRYEPNSLARSLTKHKTFTIGVILEDILNPFFTEVAKGIEVALRKKNYSMLLTSTDFDRENEIKLTRMLLRYKVDGILITPVEPESKSIALLKDIGIPFFMLNCSSPDKDINWIETDNMEGAQIATRYMLDLGHRHFMCLRQMTIEGSRKRFRSVEKTLVEAGIHRNDQVIIGDVRSRLDGYNAVSRFIKTKGTDALPTAVIAVNDAVAIGAMESLLDNDVRIPEDISIIGYDDIYIAGLVRVPLTTIHQSKFRMGEIAACQLIDKIERKERGIARQLLVKPKLIVRKSCGSPVRTHAG